MGIAVGSVGAMRSDVGGISNVAVGKGGNVLIIDVEIVAVAVTVGVIVAVIVRSWVGVGEASCNTTSGLPPTSFPYAEIAFQSAPEP